MNPEFVETLANVCADKTRGMTYPLDVIVRSSNDYVKCFTVREPGAASEVTSESCVPPEGIACPIVFEIFDSTGKRSKPIVIVGPDFNPSKFSLRQEQIA